MATASTASTVPAAIHGSTVLATPTAATVPAAAVLAADPPSTGCTAQCRAAQALKQSSHPALRQLRIEETDGSLIISGRVSTYYLKQLAQETIMSVRRDLALVNQVTVVKE